MYPIYQRSRAMKFYDKTCQFCSNILQDLLLVAVTEMHYETLQYSLTPSENYPGRDPLDGARSKCHQDARCHDALAAALGCEPNLQAALSRLIID